MRRRTATAVVAVLLVGAAVALASGAGRKAACPMPGRVEGMPRPLLPLARGNPFTTQLPSDAPVFTGATDRAFRRELRELVGLSAIVEQERFSASLYVVYKNGDVYDTAGNRKARGARFVRPRGGIPALNRGIDGRGWPIAAWMQPDDGEGHMALYNPETGAYGEFIYAKVGPRTLDYHWGGFIPDVRTSVGTSSPEDPWHGATALGLNFASTIITEAEIRHAVERYQAGDFEHAYIPHLIGYEAYRHHPSRWHYPASRTDDVGSKVPRWGVGGDANRLGNGRGVLRMGGIIRLDPAVDVQKQVVGDGTPFGDMMARIIARTLQKHGATMTDQTEAGFALLAEHVRTTDGRFDAASFSYGSGPVVDGERAWLEPMMTQVLDQGWLQFVDTGRHVEADLGRRPKGDVYRPPRCNPT